jgi:gliding motility-associated lipoprotein GldH
MLLSSCGEEPLYRESGTIDGTWNYSDSILYDLPAPDTTQGYGMVLKISHTDHYPFENLYIKIGTRYPSGRYSSNLLNVDLANKSGAWYGQCSGSNCELSVTLREFFSFSESGQYSISMQQFTRSEKLVGIRGLELQLWKSFQE